MTQVNTLWERELSLFMTVAPVRLFDSPCDHKNRINFARLTIVTYSELFRYKYKDRYDVSNARRFIRNQIYVATVKSILHKAVKLHVITDLK